VLTLVHLPRLDREQLNSAWRVDRAGVTLKVEPVGPRCRADRPVPGGAGSGSRSKEGEQAGLRHRVEGNLLAAHQEPQKLGLLYPAGELGRADRGGR
jgi:DNA polymerase-3 subunit delta